MNWSQEMNRIYEHPERHVLLHEEDDFEYPYFKCLLVEQYLVEHPTEYKRL